MTLSNLDAPALNALLWQKSRILELTYDGQLRQALELLEFSRPLWAALGYGYKWGELLKRIGEEALKRAGESAEKGEGAMAGFYRQVAEKCK